MSKIVSAVNAMIQLDDKITNVLLGNDGEIFFEYDKKYKWSIVKRDEDTVIFFYPGKETLEQLASFEPSDWTNQPMVTYRVSDLNTREARESFDELYMLVKEKLYGIDKVLNEIIKAADDLPF